MHTVQTLRAIFLEMTYVFICKRVSFVTAMGPSTWHREADFGHFMAFCGSWDLGMDGEVVFLYSQSVHESSNCSQKL